MLVTRALPQLDVVDCNKALGSPTKAPVDDKLMFVGMAVLSLVGKPMGSRIWRQVDNKDVC